MVGFCFFNWSPHLVYGSGSEALALTKEYETINSNNSRNETDSTLCSKKGPDCITEGSFTPQILIFLAGVMFGLSEPLYGNLGMAYMDDNIKRSKTPVLISE